MHVDSRFQFGLVVSGAHLSRAFGSTAEIVRCSGLQIVAEIATLPDEDGYHVRPFSMAKLIQGLLPVATAFAPDMLMAVGDREDALAVCVTGAYLKIPVAHFYGGDYGLTRDVDGHVRNACSKLASVHFVALEEHKSRLVAMGETPERIHVVGSPALDAFCSVPKIPPEKLELPGGIKVPEGEPYAVMLHHPSYASEEMGSEEAEMILTCLNDLNIWTAVGLPNVDAGSRSIIEIYRKWQPARKMCFYDKLDRRTFVNLARNASFLIGNSSMGLLEAPSIPLPVVNVGERQRGRTAARNVIFVDAEKAAIKEAIQKAMSPEFRNSLSGMVNPYGDGKSSQRVVEILSGISMEEIRFKTTDPLEIHRNFGGRL